MTNSFSLLRLPNEAQLEVLRCMDITELIHISLMSRKTKDLVKSLQIKPSDFMILIDREVSLRITSLNIRLQFYSRVWEKAKMLSKPEDMVITEARRNEKFEDNPLELTDWFEHLCDVFDLFKISELCFGPRFERFDLGAIKSTFPKVKTLYIQDMPPEQSIEILKTFLPDVNELKLERNPFDERDSGYQRMLIQNFESLRLGFIRSFRGFTLNELLICNAATINLGLNCNFKEINQFLKLWQKGANPRLQKLSIRQITKVIPEEILKGVEVCKRFSEKEDIAHRHFNNRDYKKRTAVEIPRFDGGRGTVVMTKFSFRLIVG